jgi:hypothetical protein
VVLRQQAAGAMIEQPRREDRVTAGGAPPESHRRLIETRQRLPEAGRQVIVREAYRRASVGSQDRPVRRQAKAPVDPELRWADTMRQTLHLMSVLAGVERGGRPVRGGAGAAFFPDADRGQQTVPRLDLQVAVPARLDLISPGPRHTGAADPRVVAGQIDPAFLIGCQVDILKILIRVGAGGSLHAIIAVSICGFI